MHYAGGTVVTLSVDTSRAEFDLVGQKCKFYGGGFKWLLKCNSMIVYILPGWGCVTSKSKGIAR